MFAPWKKSYDKLRQCIKEQRHHFANKGSYGERYGFLVVMYAYEKSENESLSAVSDFL